MLAALGALGAAQLAPLSSTAWAQAYPSKPIRLIVGFSPGGGIDFTARAVQPGLAEALKQQVIIDYKPGAGGMLAATELMRAAPDGYTLLLANTGPFAIAPYLQAKKPYDPKKDFTWIGQISEGGYLVTTRADHPARNIKEFVDWTRTMGDKVNYASSGNGTSTHLNGELFKQVTGAQMTHVPYKGSAPALQDLIAGQTHLLIDAGTALLPQIKAGKLKALAVTDARRDPALPDVPTAREQGFAGIETLGFQGLVGPAGMPADVVRRLSEALAVVLAQNDVKTRFSTAGSDVRVRGPQAFADYVAAENDKWAGVIRKGKLALE
jgi:tripartite-type tricarboxylate transporter receptor subunit TctC